MDIVTKAFSNITRMRLISCLGEKPKNVSELIHTCGLSQSAVSQHLNKLKESGIVECKKSGREQIYSIKHKEAVDISNKLIKFINKLKK